MHAIVQKCRHLFRTSLKRSLVAIALVIAFTIFMLIPRSREQPLAIHASSRKNAFFLGSGPAYDGGGLGQLVLKTSHESSSIPYDPYPEYNSGEWNNTWKGTYQQCVGPNGSVLDRRDAETAMKGFHWNQSDFPAPIFGSYEAWNLNRSFCVDRYSRYGAYGYGDQAHKVQWQDVNWATLQKDCLQRNADRYQPSDIREKTSTLHREQEEGTAKRHEREKRETNRDHTSAIFKPRIAVVLRTWLDMEYTNDDLYYIRSIIMELSLLSGAEYEVILLVDAKDTELPYPADLDSLKKSLPLELRDLAVFFNSEILEDWYPMIGIHEAMLQYFQPMQIFSRLNPQYDFFWQFEMDSRYTGHFYDLLQQATEFAKQQRRKNLWERNSYFYMPAIHGSWDNFTDQVDQSMTGVDSIWGPRPAKGIEAWAEAPEPPRADMEDESWSWGVGEEADLITWLPQFDPQHTDWLLTNRIYNFRQRGSTPRRASVVAMSRVSARLLRLMHKDTTEKGLGLASEMGPTSWALYYGLKAVQIPQPIYHAHETSPVELNLRANSGKPGKISAGRNSIWNWNQHNDIMMKISYMYGSQFAGKIYRAWLGYDGADDVSGFAGPLTFLLKFADTTRKA
ncbi:uncharacterized protein N7518_008115 [Penicillium psychrosexuale]|uniref:uncharacterized protein n=1 Tax=Penicillium psychrosexuale TaxID=1002107 RepID=UPI002545B53D|nr:uncharacterized protein N7518_008115 [Penicillium psychrosexuale]KAJ5791104.1 hypothetical protein N7518_008115 [Penicillium psychrosexuale]